MNTTVRLSFKPVTSPDLGGFKFYVEACSAFDADAYAEAYGLNRADIDAQDIHSAQDAAARLNDGEWLEVAHEAGDAHYSPEPARLGDAPHKQRGSAMELRTFTPEDAPPFRARAEVFQHSPYEAHVRLQSPRAAGKFSGRTVRFGRFGAVIDSITTTAGCGCPHCSGIEA